MSDADQTPTLRARREPEYWRSLAERLDTPEFRASVPGEFPPGVDEPPLGLSRRHFLQLLGGSMALAGLGACSRAPAERILPYNVQPPEVTPGVPLRYATAMELDGYATGLLVQSREGRPVKIEGNPDHPASLGASGAWEQAWLLELYDPGRARQVRFRGTPRSWTDWASQWAPGSGRSPVGAGGAGLRVLLEPTGSPLLGALLARLRQTYPEARVYFHSPLRVVRPAVPQHDFGAADAILALDSDFLASGPFSLRNAREFAARRRDVARMNRLYAVEGMPTPTGSLADHRFPLRTGEIPRVAAALLAELRGGGGGPEWLRAVAADLRAHAGRSVVIAGERQPDATHQAVRQINAALGNTGRTVWYTPSPLLGAGIGSYDLAPLVREMESGRVQTLLVLGGDPAYTAPADVPFASALRRVPHTAYLGLHDNATAAVCQWMLPAAHGLEAWGDARAYDGTVSPVQPLIAPLYGGHTPAEALATLLGEPGASAHALLQSVWRERAGADWETWWAEALQRGTIPGTAFERTAETPSLSSVVASPAPTAPPGTLEAVFREDPSVYDGRFAPNAWLQELPHPLSKLTWDNAAYLSPATAARLGVETGDVLDLHLERRTVRAPALVLPGHADDSVSLPLGYGHADTGGLARGVGFDAYRLRSAAAPYVAAGLRVERVLTADGAPVRYPLALTQTHWSMEGRPIVLRATREEYLRNPHFTREQSGRSLSLYSPWEYRGEQWAMMVDLSVCTGCSACVVACQAENNIPVVGKQGVLNRREMHWLRIDRYFTGDPANPVMLHQPMACQHCEKAPCEYVCPVNATVHSPDGLNEMIYNRCVGTRFCSNNCPYKVRRFNWFNYNAPKPETVQMAMNPEVTVRARGVMEKCTYCVQRIRRAQIDEQLSGVPMVDGELQTACQQACPTEAIVFGSLGDRDSRVSRLRREPRSYSVLHELGTEPRTQYLARITHPNPALPV